MYPAIFGRVAKLGSNSVRSANVLLRKSMFLHSTISAPVISHRTVSSLTKVRTTTKRVMSFAAEPKPTNVWGGSSPAETAALFIGISSIICGGIYYLSNSAKKSPVCEKALEILRDCPEVFELLNVEDLRTNLVRGRTKNGKSKITIALKGKKHTYLVIVEGREDSETGEVTIENLSIHKKGDLSNELYIYKNGELVAEMEKELEEKNGKEVVVTAEEVEEVPSTTEKD